MNAKTRESKTREYRYYLRDEIEKRWPLLYKRRWHNLWVCAFPSGELSSFYLSEYSELDGDNRSVLRLRDRVNSFNPPKGRVFFTYGNNLSEMEFSFLSDEIETAIPWVLDNYLLLQDFPDWIHPSPNVTPDRLGKPLSFYFWTASAREAKDKEYNERIARRNKRN